MDKCRVCGSEHEQLFSNRPLHKGQQETLLICMDCVDGLSASNTTIDGTCHWCGAESSVIPLNNELNFCARCVETCQLILS